MYSPPLPPALLTRDGLKLHVSHWPVAAPKGVVVLLHGLCEHAGRYDELARKLNELQWAVVAPDHRGHGRSEGPRGAMASDDDPLHDLASLMDLVATHYVGFKRVLLGISMGGAIAARFASAAALPVEDAEWSRPIDGLILSAPALLPTMSLVQKTLLSTMGRLMQDLAVPVVFRPEWASSNPDAIRELLADPLVHWRITPRLALFMANSGQTALRRAPAWNTPTLLLYSEIDRLVTPSGCAQFANALPPGLGTTHAYTQLAHDLWHEPQRAVAYKALGQWLSSQFRT
ncbi:MAG: alpha/beta hydrolase [Rubrivivax sp.]|nr:MAG: alpha/beta hydrolase [Rubrivivax sp.]